MKQIIDEMFELKDWAVVGATPSKHKFGYKIFSKLRGCHYNVVPINPMYETIEGVPCYANFAHTQGIRVVNVVVPPSKSLPLLDELVAHHIEYVWFQPGTYDEEVLDRAKELGLKVVYGYCVLVEMGDLPFCPF
jgi:predicted CoA-binding protein